jgi:hypothetical protein
LFTSLRGDVLKVKRERCIVHPVKKRAAIKENEIIDYASDINVVLAYYNLEDKRRDNGSKLSAAAMLVLKSDFKKLRSKYSGKCDIIENRLKELDKLEKEKCSSMDAAAEPFAKLMEEVLDYKEVFKDEKLRNLLRWIGYNMGKWIYILDAYDDLEEDIKDKHYNPLIYQYSYNNEDIKAFKLKIKNR